MLKLIPGQWPPSPDEVHGGPEYQRGAGEESEAPAQGGSPGRRGETEVSQGGGGRLQGEGVQAPAEGGLGGGRNMMEGGQDGRGGSYRSKRGQTWMEDGGRTGHVTDQEGCREEGVVGDSEVGSHPVGEHRLTHAGEVPGEGWGVSRAMKTTFSHLMSLLVPWQKMAASTVRREKSRAGQEAM